MKHTLILLLLSTFVFGQSTGPVVKPGDRTTETWSSCDTLITKDTVIIDTLYFSTSGGDTLITANFRYGTISDRQIDSVLTSKVAYLDSVIQILDAKIAEMEYLSDYHYILFLVSRTQLKNLKPGVHNVPTEIDKEVARLKLASMGGAVDVLTPAQELYLNSWEHGS